MTVTLEELKNNARLAHLTLEPQDCQQLDDEINAIMDYVEQLRSVDTTGVVPLSHPFALHQPLRADVITEESCLAELEAIAPLFEDKVYLVPKVIDSGN